MTTPRAIKRAAARAAEPPKSIEARAAEARAARQNACATKIQTLMNDILVEYNCRVEFTMVVGSQQIPASTVLSAPLTIRVLANIEESRGT